MRWTTYNYYVCDATDRKVLKTMTISSANANALTMQQHRRNEQGSKQNATKEGETMRISDIGNWSSCESMALHSPPRTAGRQNVASWVGTLAHGILSGIDPVEPDRLAYDTLTPSAHHALVQAQHIAQCARDLLTAQGWGVIGHEEELRRDELIGHLDIRAYHQEHGEAIIDLKSGAQIGAAFIQVGGYLWLDQQRIPWGGVLHVPRVAINKDVKGTLQLRPSGPLQTEWQRWQRRIREITDGASPTRSPGYHCGRCQLADCPVRIVAAKP